MHKGTHLHKNKKNILCPHCKMRFIRRDHLKLHVGRKHTKYAKGRPKTAEQQDLVQPEQFHIEPDQPETTATSETHVDRPEPIVSAETKTPVAAHGSLAIPVTGLITRDFNDNYSTEVYDERSYQKFDQPCSNQNQQQRQLMSVAVSVDPEHDKNPFLDPELITQISDNHQFPYKSLAQFLDGLLLTSVEYYKSILSGDQVVDNMS